MDREIDLDDRRNDPEPQLNDDLREFVTALALALHDEKWYAIESIEEYGSEFRVTLRADYAYRNAIGNAYVHELLNLGYAITGYSNHYRDDDSLDTINFVPIAHDEQFGEERYTDMDDTDRHIKTSPRERLHEINVQPALPEAL